MANSEARYDADGNRLVWSIMDNAWIKLTDWNEIERERLALREKDGKR
ncbi:hypothetical protein [Nocardia jiangxiensis]|nr:hypothetical protein [Nocardia jiangxiensis]